MIQSTLAARIAAELERDRRDRVSEFGHEALAWLAFPPVWTDRLARACLFPERPLPLEELLDRAEEVGWCVRRETRVRARTPALRLHLMIELGELSGTSPRALLDEILGVEDEALRAQLLERLAAEPPPEPTPHLVPQIHAAARGIDDPVAAADVMLAIATRDREHAESVRLYLRGLLDQITDPEARATRLLRFRELTVVETRAWRREFLGFLAQIRSPARVARLLRDAAPWLDEDDVPSLVPPAPEALGDAAVALARSGHHDQARRLANQIADDRLRLQTLAELLAPLAEQRGRTFAADLERQCLVESERADVVTRAKVLACVVRAGTDLPVAQMLEVEHRAAATSAEVGALQRLAESALNNDRVALGLRLAMRSAELADQLSDPTARAAHLAEAARIVIPGPAAYPADRERALGAATVAVRAVHDDEDRARAFARAAQLAEDGTYFADQALRLAARLDESATVTSFWVPENARSEILGELQRQQGSEWVRACADTIGRRVADARDQDSLAPEAMTRWAQLAVADGSAAQALDARIKRILDVGDTVQALAWLDTAKTLAPILLGEFETSVVANTRRVELVHRREQDRKRLAEFMPRIGQLAAFDALLDQGDGAPWALHYLGVGGVGKTTLIRHLTAELAPRRGVVTSRIDFDHLNPDYPRRRPAQLLLELATELEAHAQDRREMTLFRQAYEQLMEINAAAMPAAPPITVADDRFQRAIRTFGGFLQALDAPVVLVLDTCEELEKFQPVGGRIEQLEATFDLLEALHEAVPRLRVVLAGRRPLARAGHGWQLADRDEEPQVLLPERKSYLSLHEVAGFHRAEAVRFLGPGHKNLHVEPDLRDAILGRSEDPGTPARLEWSERPPSQDRRRGVRYNPFDLDHYANWVRSEPSLTVADVTSRERDVYVESRIIGRLKRPDVEHVDLARVLPAVAALGRFDRDMLRPAFVGAEGAFADAWRELAATEWVDIQHDAALDTTFLEIDRGLRPRLEAYYQRPENSGVYQEAARRLGPGLARLVDERPPERLGVDHVAAALRLLQPAEAARLVDRLARNVIEEAAWGWAERVVERVLADQPELGRPEHPAAAGLSAVLASALAHLDPGRDRTALWDAVEAAVRAHPDEEMGGWLSTRMLLAQGEVIHGPSLLAKASEERERLQDWVFETLAEQTDEQRRQVLVGGLLAAVAARLDEAEADGRPRVDLDPNALETAVLTEPPAVRAFTRVLSARAFLLDARFDEAERLFGEAVALVSQPGPPPSPWLRADWVPPEDLVRRVWLEALRAPVKEVGSRFPEVGSRSLGPPPMPEGRLGGIDADRFASAALLRRLSREVVPGEELSAYERFEDLLEIREPACHAHRAVPPLFITVARGWMVLGEAGRARTLLHRGQRAAIIGRDPELVWLVELATLEVARRFRNLRSDRSLRERVRRYEDARMRRYRDGVGWESATALAALVEAHRPPPGPELGDALRQDPLALGSFEGRPLDVVGLRRAAELRLAEGELTALDDPRHAAAMLDDAAALFEKSGDRFGAFAATVTAALARARAGESPVEDSARRIERVYEALRQDHGDDLPELQGETRTLQSLESSVWEGWMYRLLVARAWAARPDVLPRLLDAIEERGALSSELDVLQRLQQPDSPDALRPPVSMPSAPSPPSSLPQPEPPDRGSPPQRLRTLLTVAVTLVAILLGVILIFVPGTDRVGQAGGDPGDPEGGASGWAVPGWPVIGGLVSLALAAAIGFWFARQARRPRASAARPNLPLPFEWVGWRGLQAWRYRRQRSAHLTLRAAANQTGTEGIAFELSRHGYHSFVGFFVAQVPGSAPYEQQTTDVLPERLRRELRAGSSLAGVALDLQYMDDGAAWEAPVLLALGDVGIPCWRRPRPWAPDGQPGRRTLRIRRVRCFVIAPPTWSGVLLKLGGRTRGEVVGPAGTPAGDPVAGVSPGPSGDALVLLGTPVETSAGLRLRVASVTTKGSEPEDYIEPDSLGLWGLPLSLVVVMGEPSESLVRVDAEREQAADLRRVAADLLDAGAPAVLCLPAMPPALAGEVLKVLGRHLRRIRAFGGWELVRASTRIRRTIAAAGTTDEERAGAKELALDVTVWIRPEWSQRSDQAK